MLLICRPALGIARFPTVFLGMDKAMAPDSESMEKAMVPWGVGTSPFTRVIRSDRKGFTENVANPGDKGFIPKISSVIHFVTPALQGCVRLVYPHWLLIGASFGLETSFHEGLYTSKNVVAPYRIWPPQQSSTVVIASACRCMRDMACRMKYWLNGE